MSNFDSMRDCPHGRQKGKCDSCDLEQAANLLEQQAAEIADNETVIRSLCLERDALKAHVERLLEFDLTPEEYHRLTVSQRYKQNLAERDAEVARKAFIAGFQKGKIKRPVVDLRNPIDLANEYAQRIKENT